MMNEIASLLFTIAGVSASFVAILGGCIATKLISINQERESYKNKLSEIHFKKLMFTEQRNMYKTAMDEADALCYIQENSDAFVSGCELENIYDENEPHYIEYETLLPYWNQAKLYKAKFDDRLRKGKCDFNDLMIPVDLLEETGEDSFAFHFYAMYARWGFSEYFEESEYAIRGEWYENAKQESLNANTQALMLDIEEQRYEMDLKSLKKPKGMKLGLAIFALFSMVNIILPLVFSMIPISGIWCTIVAFCSIGLLALGLVSTFLYFAQMLKWKE
jgi:hypothetical protein